MIDLSQLIRPSVRALQPYSSARNEYSGISDVYLDANENPSGTLNRYPDPFQGELKARISELKKLPASSIFIGNGSDEIIDLLFRLFCDPGKDSVVILPPTYGMYEVCAALNDTDVLTCPLDTAFDIDLLTLLPMFTEQNVKVLFLCSPNNPTGNVLSPDRILEVLNQFNGIVVVDEAYIDFSNTTSWINQLERFKNLVVLQTMSKAFGLAAARVGIAYASPIIVEYLTKIKPPYNVSLLNQRAALERLSEIALVQKEIDQLKIERERLSLELTKIPCCIHLFPSEANFLLVQFTDADAVYYFLKKNGIIVRNRNTQISGCLRITVGLPKENDLLLNTLKSFNQ